MHKNCNKNCYETCTCTNVAAGAALACARGTRRGPGHDRSARRYGASRRRPRSNVRAAAITHPGGQTAASAATHAADMEPAAPAALPAVLAAATAAEAASRGLHTGYTERAGQKRCRNGRRAGQNGGNGRRRAARAGVVVVAAAGPGKAVYRRAGPAAGRARGRAHTPPCRHRRDQRPRCPMKDTSPEGDRAEDLPKEDPVPSGLRNGQGTSKACSRSCDLLLNRAMLAAAIW